MTMHKLISITIFFVSILMYSQVEIKISPVENFNNLKYLDIDIYNNSNEVYIIPLDTLDLRPFDNYYKWKNFDNAEIIYGSLSLTLFVKEKNDIDYLSAIFKSPHIDEQKLNQMEKQFSIESKLKSKKLEKWRKKNKIDNGINVEKNFYLVNNLIIIKPKQKLTIHRKIDNEFRQEILRSYILDYIYAMKGNTDYEIFIQLDVPQDINKFLTKKQRKKIKKFKIFEGQVKSNLIPFKFFL